MSNIQLHWVQLHVSALCIGHHQVVLRLVEQLCNKRGVLGGVGGGETRSVVVVVPNITVHYSSNIVVL